MTLTLDLMRVLVVDDDADMRLTSTEFLQALGLEVVGCATLEAAKVAIQQQPIDAVLADISFPGRRESGLDLCAWIRREHPSIQVHVLSGADESRGAALSAGAFRFWLKPTDLKMIADLILESAPSGSR